MHLIQPQAHSRRAFLRRSAQLAFTGAALPTALNLAAMGEAAALSAPSGSYNALVCVFLYGGNDYANTVVPYDAASYAAYSAVRGGGSGQSAGGVALARSTLAPTLLTPAVALPAGQQYAFHPTMTGMASLFSQGKLAVQLNVGPQIVPMNKAQYEGGNRVLYPLPPKLFSHNDQQSVWQSSSPEGSTIGWGGKVGDLALAGNGSGALFTCISVTGNAVFLAGDSAQAYQVGPGGAVKIYAATDEYTYGSNQLKAALLSIAQQSRIHVLENEYNKVTKRAIGAEGIISSGINSGRATGSGPEFSAFSGTAMQRNPLAAQLKMVARLIEARSTLGTKRQVFFVSLGGFDLHDNLVDGHVKNMKRVNDAMTAFYQTTASLGVANDVTAFTASEFGRTLTSNGDGSDHGWGGHQFVVGGAVKGNAFYGYAPPVGAGDTNGPQDAWHVGQGRLIPTTSVDQYGATLATWFGVQPTELAAILPNINNFGGSANGINYPVNLGFL